MISAGQAEQFAKEWIGAWNAHDLEKILSHYADRVEFSSPFAVRLLNEPSGTVYGKDRLRNYFAKGLAAYPDLKFELLHAFASIQSVVLTYRSVKNLLAAEVMFFDPEGTVIKVVAHYTEPQPA